jgi:chromosome segregation ATPase
MSDAALASIAELQQRIKVLENDGYNLKLEYESLRDQLAVQESEFGDRESGLSSANTRAQAMLQNSSELLAQLTASRAMNATLKDQVAQSELVLAKQRRKNRRFERELTDTTQRLSDVMSQLSIHETLIGEICSPPKQSALLTQDEALLLSVGDIPSDLLPRDLAQLHAKLQALPKSFRSQDLETKKQMVYTLVIAKGAAQQLFSRIKFGEKRKFASSAPHGFETNAKRLAQQQCVICDDMRQFSFTSVRDL